ncbi:MAG: hypothetical protein B6241_09090 [Spirochaetaceae bacterium 4572_59]|nr:MAG: hypothetical protein B6241_09090 [Spirochaetaceae bacterium 4572_59]
MRHPKLREWDRKLKAVCDRIDSWLEDEYGDLYRLRPNRAERGETCNPEMDGLFNIQAVFTPGYGSEKGRGYIIEIEISTLDIISQTNRQKIDKKVLFLIKQDLLKEDGWEYD